MSAKTPPPQPTRYSLAFASALAASGKKDAEVARKLGVAATMVYQWKTGRRPIAYQYAEAAGVELQGAPEEISEAYADLCAMASNVVPIARALSGCIATSPDYPGCYGKAAIATCRQIRQEGIAAQAQQQDASARSARRLASWKAERDAYLKAHHGSPYSTDVERGRVVPGMSEAAVHASQYACRTVDTSAAGHVEQCGDDGDFARRAGIPLMLVSFDSGAHVIEVAGQ
jgi:hypothetical protein